MTHLDSFRVDLAPSKLVLTATRYSFIVPTQRIKEINFQVSCVGTGSPVGTWSWEGSDDPLANNDYWKEQQTASILGASVTGSFVALTTPTTVHGSALAITGSSATKSEVAWVLGLPDFMRAVFTYTSGGSAASLASVYATGRQ